MSFPTIRFTVNDVAPLLNKWQRMHYRTRKKIKLDWMRYISVLADKPKAPIDSCNITIHRYCSGKLPDWDNLYSSAKTILDSLVDLGFIVDDSPEYVRRLDMFPHQCARKDHRTVIIIEPVGLFIV